MLASTGYCNVASSSNREWVVIHQPRVRTWTCDHHRTQVRASARSSKRGSGDLHDPWREEERRQALLKYVQEVQPNSVVQFAEQTHPTVVHAMRQTVLNVVGSLPPQYFDVRISTMAESLAQLMLSIMTTGYMLRSAQFRMELQNSLRQLPTVTSGGSSGSSSRANIVAGTGSPTSTSSTFPAPTVAALSSAEDAVAPAPGGVETVFSDAEGGDLSGGPGPAFLYDGGDSPYAPGVQKKNVEGEVLRWHQARGEVERMRAADYIELLEREVAALRAQVVPQPAGPSSSASPNTATSTSSFTSSSTDGVEVLGPDTELPGPTANTSGQNLACVSPLPGFGERSGLAAAGAAAAWGAQDPNAAAAAAAGSAAAPASMGSGGIPLVVGSPLGLPRNELLDYLHGLQAGGSGGFKELACSPSSSSGQAVKEAMELFVARLMGTADPESLTKMTSEFSSVELSKVLFWLMAVGYTLKSIENRLEIDDGSDGGLAGSGGSSRGPTPRGGGGGGNNGGGGSSSKSSKGNGAFRGLRGLIPGF